MSNGRVASLHLHPAEGGAPMESVVMLELQAGQGIAGNRRYFNRGSRRQVSLIEREQMAAHATALGRGPFAPGDARSDIETEGIDLVPLVGKRLAIGTAVIELYAPRDPCAKMDALAPGLRELMKPHRQGVMAIVVHSGTVCCGDGIRILAPEGA
jgi:MOSC domain-containing protein YiiM